MIDRRPAGGFDVIGDVHGHAEPLERLLGKLGYQETGGVYGHPERQAVFVGDLIDRGPEQIRVMAIVRAMVEAGSALIALGNHELNAMAWATPDGRGDFRRTHSQKNRRQHASFLEQVGEDSAVHRDWIAWFRTLPLWLDLDGVRIVHACWHPASMEVVGSPVVSDEVINGERGSALFQAVDVLLKGPEIEMDGLEYVDKDGHRRKEARLRWWDPDATTLATACEIPSGVTAPDGGVFGPLSDRLLDDEDIRCPPIDVPVFYGHYWRSGTPAIDGPKSACLDWSVAKGGPLVAYRWSGETELTNQNLVAVPGTG